jgi:hypothetical protein
MKVILPNLAIALLTIGQACAQSVPAPLDSAPSTQMRPNSTFASTVVPVESATGVGTLPSQISGDRAFQLPDAPPVTQLNKQPDGADLLLQRANAAVAQQRSIAARIRYHSEMFGNHLIGKGLYLQQGLGLDRKMRLELETPIGEQNLVLEQICDGQFIWQYQPPIARIKQSAPERPTVTRIDLHRVLLAMEQDKREQRSDVAGQLALGGLPKLMEGLRQSFRFNRAEAGKLGSLPVWIATGSWRPEALAVFAKDLADQAAKGHPLNLKWLPQQLPEEVSLYLGQDDLFPYRIEYRRRTAQQGRGADTGGDMLPIVVVEFCDVRLNTPIDSQQFEYRPGNADIVDTTQNFIKALGLVK